MKQGFKCCESCGRDTRHWSGLCLRCRGLIAESDHRNPRDRLSSERRYHGRDLESPLLFAENTIR